MARSTAYFESTTSTEPPLRRWAGILVDMTGASYEKEGHGPIKANKPCAERSSTLHSDQNEPCILEQEKKTPKNRANRVNELGRMRGCITPLA